MKYATIGSISSGTMRNIDLIETFANELEYLREHNRKNSDLDHASLLKLINEAREWLSQNEDNGDDYTGPDHFCDGDEMLCDLADALEQFAGPYVYFGSHPGDGADFGYWPSMDSIDELPCYEDTDAAKEAGEQDDFRVVNDHGNVTVYAADGTEIIGIV